MGGKSGKKYRKSGGGGGPECGGGGMLRRKKRKKNEVKDGYFLLRFVISNYSIFLQTQKSKNRGKKNARFCTKKRINLQFHPVYSNRIIIIIIVIG